MVGSILLDPWTQSAVLNMVASWNRSLNRRHNIKLRSV